MQQVATLNSDVGLDGFGGTLLAFTCDATPAQTRCAEVRGGGGQLADVFVEANEVCEVGDSECVAVVAASVGVLGFVAGVAWARRGP